MRWSDVLKQGHVEIGGQRYGVDHLLASSFQLAIPATPDYAAVTAQVNVEYSSHCVTYGPEKNSALDFAAIGEEHRIFDHRNVARAFCFDRHRWSLQLPAAVNGLHGQTCFFTDYGNWLVIEDITDQGMAVEYEIFFSLRAGEAARSLRLYIESAYVRDPGKGRPGMPKSRRGKVRFYVMAGKRLRGEPVRNPMHNRR